MDKERPEAPEFNNSLENITLKEFGPDSVIKISTKNRDYKLENTADGWLISGHPEHCPTPTKTTLDPVLNLGTRFLYLTPEHPEGIWGTRIQKITIEKALENNPEI